MSMPPTWHKQLGAVQIALDVYTSAAARAAQRRPGRKDDDTDDGEPRTHGGRHSTGARMRSRPMSAKRRDADQVDDAAGDVHEDGDDAEDDADDNVEGAVYDVEDNDVVADDDVEADEEWTTIFTTSGMRSSTTNCAT